MSDTTHRAGTRDPHFTVSTTRAADILGMEGTVFKSFVCRHDAWRDYLSDPGHVGTGSRRMLTARDLVICAALRDGRGLYGDIRSRLAAAVRTCPWGTPVVSVDNGLGLSILYRPLWELAEHPVEDQ